MVRYGEKVAVSNIVVMKRDPAFAWNGEAENNYVDRLVNAKLRQMEILPSELTSDEEFLRAGLLRRHRRAADARTRFVVSWRTRAPTSGASHRPLAGTAGTRRVLGLEVGRSAQAAV